MFDHKRGNLEYGALLDIGSGSVTVSVVASVLSQNKLDCIWSHQERLRLRESKRDADGQTKHILAALVNAMLALGQTGVATVRQYDHRATIATLQCSVAAPWSYTISKSAQLTKDEPFTLTKQLLRELIQATEAKIYDELHENEITASLELKLVNRSVAQLLVNDYPVDVINGQKALGLEIKMLSVVLQEYLQAAIVKNQETILPSSVPKIYSYMNMLYYVLQHTRPEMREYCLVNLTFEATEIGIVRDGMLTFSTHESYGIANYVYDLAQAIGTEPVEVLGWFESDLWHEQLKELSKSKQETCQQITKDYQQLLTGLFEQTGDDFTIPKTIYVHAVTKLFAPFSGIIYTASEQASNFKHIVHNVDEEILQSLPEDCELQAGVNLISALFFHIHGHDTRFTHY